MIDKQGRAPRIMPSEVSAIERDADGYRDTTEWADPLR
jgi:hypothetical protein